MLRSEVSRYDQTQRSEFTLALNLDILDDGQSPKAVRVHAGTSQVNFEVDRPPPAACPPGDTLITMVKETVILFKKSFEKWKKVVSLIDLKGMKTRNDCKIARDCVKRANVVLHVGQCKEILARKHTAAHKSTSAQPLIVTTMTHTHTHTHIFSLSSIFRLSLTRFVRLSGGPCRCLASRSRR